MTPPLVSIVIETVTARCGAPPGSLPRQLAATLAALKRQTYPCSRFETIIVTGPAIPRAEMDSLARSYPGVRLVATPQPGYFAAKNAGAAAALGDFVLLLDGDCVPEDNWVERLTGRFDSTVAVVGGRTRYAATGAVARLLSIPDFGYVFTAADGDASGFNLNNVAFRRETLLEHPLDARIRRNGACYLLFHRLRAAGLRIVHEPAARVSHGLDGGRLGFLRKHFDRGYDSIAAYRADDDEVLRGTPWFRRLGVAALAPIFARRIAIDWLTLARHRRQIGFPLRTLPLMVPVATFLRLIELAGGFAGAARRPTP